jgi:glycosyltransferase involved in cell wall biosynthesis
MKHSVIIPAYNAAAYIEQSLGSTLSQLSTTEEIIIVDDGSIDETVDRVAGISDARILFLRQPDITLAKARLGREPKVDPENGLKVTKNFFKNSL